MIRIEEFQLPVTMCPPALKIDSDILEAEKKWYVRGNIPGAWISKASNLPGDHTLHAALAIWYAKGLGGKSYKVTLDRFIFERFGVGCDSARRALTRLQEAGLIKYERVGHRHEITILPVKSDTVAETDQ